MAVVVFGAAVLCVLVLVGGVSAERASAVAVVAGAGVATVRVTLAGQYGRDDSSMGDSLGG
ncbi:hypothetical protein [Streptomyces physcomitrii]|uniref:Secreted protein n=1 Tax=Streptomyces physcomitrii TaxID=2724184 RepID=A0ABX1H2V5_9ACTN|nr:hypothetical protein [Streptomyces physcomitrii]NKI42363.1 hypothetical protein [Streptomyces physcomitrii]